MKPPTYHELSILILNKEVAYTNELLSNHKESWGKHGSSIMSSGWTNRTNQTLINILVNYSTGIITNSGSNYVLVGKLLEAKRPNMYWIPCTTHCIDLMLEYIEKIP